MVIAKRNVLLSTLVNALPHDSDFKVKTYNSKVVKDLKTLAKKS